MFLLHVSITTFIRFLKVGGVFTPLYPLAPPLTTRTIPQGAKYHEYSLELNKTKRNFR